MLNRIPFNKNLYLKTFAAVLVGVINIFVAAVLLFDYELTTADPVGVPVASALLAYIIHLGFWNPEE